MAHRTLTRRIYSTRGLGACEAPGGDGGEAQSTLALPKSAPGSQGICLLRDKAVYCELPNFA
jgi:hypothetical protein